MRAILLVGLMAALPTWATAAEKTPKEPPARPHRIKDNPCAVYGAGFVKVEGTSTCIKLGGSVDAEVAGYPGR